MQKILYASDFSENSAVALEYALKLAQKSGAELLMLHVFDIPTTWDYPQAAEGSQLKKMAINDSKTKLKKLLDHYSKDNNQTVKVHLLARENIAVNKGIMAEIEAQKPDLLVLGTKGGSKAHEIIVGSTTRLLTKDSPCPMLAVPNGTNYKPFNSIAYASDLLEDDMEALKNMVHLFKPYEPQITIVHVNKSEYGEEEEQMAWFQELVKEKLQGVEFKYKLFKTGRINETINEFIQQNNFDFLVMMEKARKGMFDALFHGDHVKKMEFHTSIPLLIFNQKYLEYSGFKS